MSDESKAIEIRGNETMEIAPHYGSRQDIIQLGKRIKALMPGGQKLSIEQAMSAAEAAILSDANLFRGDIYVYEDKGQLVVADGYKLLVREAKRQSDYAETYFDLTPEEREKHNIADDSIAVWVYILRDDRRRFYQQALQDAKEFGLNFREARKEALEAEATKALGIVTKRDMTKRNGEPMDPPNTLTWEDVAKKRGLKHALRRAYALPSPREIAQRSWIVGNTQTVEADWDGVEVYDSQPERERAAQLNAWERERQEQWEAMSEDEQAAKVAHNVEVMRDNDADPLDLAPDDLAEDEPEPTPEPTKPKAKNGGKVSGDVSTRFWLLAGKKGIDRDAGLALIGEHGGSVDDALEALKKLPAGEPVQKSMIEQEQPNNYHEK